mmetsp:Transcript_9470/g.38694  ORF Transcript_9470/g.38694 Transcript_9470/m.38694 type:complete len:105 (+) Transcript_9470:746-1060(+)
MTRLLVPASTVLTAMTIPAQGTLDHYSNIVRRHRRRPHRAVMFLSRRSPWHEARRLSCDWSGAVVMSVVHNKLDEIPPSAYVSEVVDCSSAPPLLSLHHKFVQT